MVFSPALVVFAGLSLLGVLLVFVRSGMLGIWVGLELGLFGFLPILNGKTVGENEAAVKYFVVQAVGSGIMLFRFLFIRGDTGRVGSEANNYDFVSWLMVGGFIVKLGVFPLHFWFPSVIGRASWFRCFWLSVVQKVGPF